MRFIALVLLAAALSVAGPAAALIPLYSLAVEYYNQGTGHYFITAEPDEMVAVEAGAAGPGWRRTGYMFTTYHAGSSLGSASVCRFYAPSQNSHFHTADAAECSYLRSHLTGWNFEGIAFNIDPPVDGSCRGASPVFRLYNNRFQLSDSNHRFTPDPAERDKMVAQGWRDEGIAYCTPGWSRQPAKWFQAASSFSDVLPSAQCLGENGTEGPCVALFQLPPMPVRISKYLAPPFETSPNPEYPSAADSLTGLTTTGIILTGHSVDGPQAVLAHSFLQYGPALGIRLVSRDRTSALPYSSIDAAYRFRTAADIVATRPWDDGYNHDLVVSFDLLVKTLRQVDPASHAYGHPLIEFIDRQSGLRFYVTLGAYGTAQPGDFVGRHAVTGNVIVSTFFREAPRFGRRLAGQWIACGGCVPETAFKFAINRPEFAQVLALARTLEPALSADPVDYRLANFRFQNEAYGDAESGVTINNLKLEIFFAR